MEFVVENRLTCLNLKAEVKFLTHLSVRFMHTHEFPSAFAWSDFYSHFFA